MAYDHHLCLRALSEFTHLLLTAYDIEDVLPQLSERVTGVLDVAGCGVTLARDGRLEFDSGSGGEVAVLEAAQEQAQQGPCVDAYTSGEVVAVADLAQERERWPAYCEAAARTSIGAVASIPMRVDGMVVGVVDLYARGTREWEEDDLMAAGVMANMATAYLVNFAQQREQAALTEQLQGALDARVVIEQAKGMLAARHGTSPQEAFELLRAHARSHRLKVRDVAAAVVGERLAL